MTKDCEPKQIVLPAQVDEILTSAGLSLGEWYLPAKGAAAELNSLRGQMRTTKCVPEVRTEVMDKAIDIVVKMYPETSITLAQCVSSSNVYACLKAVNKDASPGFPLGLIFKSNGELMEHPVYYPRAVALARARLIALSRLDPNTLDKVLECDPTWAIRHNLSDPIRNFVKAEPHNRKKIDEKRYRLINSLSFVEQLEERFMFTTQDETEIANWKALPSKSGMGLGDDQVQALLEYASAHGLNTSTDVRAWDAHAPDQVLRAEMECRIRLNKSGDALWSTAARNLCILHSHRVLMLSDGRCYKRVVLGGQASGRKVTSSSNGRARGLLDTLAALHFGYAPRFMTQGDDDVAYTPTDVAEEAYCRYFQENFNVTITDWVRREGQIDTINFCSQLMTNSGGTLRCVPERPEKQLARFAVSTDAAGRDSALDSLQLNLRHDERLPVYLAVARELLKARK